MNKNSNIHFEAAKERKSRWAAVTKALQLAFPHLDVIDDTHVRTDLYPLPDTTGHVRVYDPAAKRPVVAFFLRRINGVDVVNHGAATARPGNRGPRYKTGKKSDPTPDQAIKIFKDRVKANAAFAEQRRQEREQQEREAMAQLATWEDKLDLLESVIADSNSGIVLLHQKGTMNATLELSGMTVDLADVKGDNGEIRYRSDWRMDGLRFNGVLSITDDDRDKWLARSLLETIHQLVRLHVLKQ